MAVCTWAAACMRPSLTCFSLASFVFNHALEGMLQLSSGVFSMERTDECLVPLGRSWSLWCFWNWEQTLPCPADRLNPIWILEHGHVALSHIRLWCTWPCFQICPEFYRWVLFPHLACSWIAQQGPQPVLGELIISNFIYNTLHWNELCFLS